MPIGTRETLKSVKLVSPRGASLLFKKYFPFPLLGGEDKGNGVIKNLKLIIGLGNPGRTYAKNRHNVGFMCVSHFAREQGIELNKKQGKARIGTGEIAGSIIVVARPQTGMNLSGQSAELMVKKFNIEPDSLIVIHDDLDLPLGKIRLSYSAG